MSLKHDVFPLPLLDEKKKTTIYARGARKSTFQGRDLFGRTSNLEYLCQFEDKLMAMKSLFIVPKEDYKTAPSEVGLRGLLSGSIINYDVLNAAGDRIFIVSQCSKTASGFKRNTLDPLLYTISNLTGQELMTIHGTFALCRGFICGRGVQILLGGTIIGSVSKHINSVYVVKDDHGQKTYIINKGGSPVQNQVAIEYLYDNLVAADIAWGKIKGMFSKDKVVYSVHFDKESNPCPEAKALLTGAAIVLFHDKYRAHHSTRTKETAENFSTSISKESILSVKSKESTLSLKPKDSTLSLKPKESSLKIAPESAVSRNSKVVPNVSANLSTKKRTVEMLPK